MNKAIDNNIQQLATAVIDTEISAIEALKPRIDEAFVQACQYMLNCDGRVIVIGMGKSGHIGNKIAATLASTGTPAFFVHPGEASHGDLGMFTDKDVVIALSNSGETEEILTILPLIKRLGVPLIALTGNPSSTLAKCANTHIDVSVEREACPLNLAPTASTTASLVMGDALAVALLETRGFSKDDFALSHPGGLLGRKLLLRVSDIMHTGDDIPNIKQSAPLTDALLEMSSKGLGMTAITNDTNQVIGIFTDGDLRRILSKETNIHDYSIGEVMTTQCKTGQADMLAAESLSMMQQAKINALLITDNNSKLVGAINMHDLLRAGVV